jgi:lipoate-protein ligase A
MSGRRILHAATLAIAATLALFANMGKARSESPNDLQTLEQRVAKLSKSGKYRKALTLQLKLATEVEKAETAASGPAQKRSMRPSLSHGTLSLGTISNACLRQATGPTHSRPTISSLKAIVRMRSSLWAA